MNMALKHTKAVGIKVHADFLLAAYRAYSKIDLTEFPNTVEGIENTTKFLLKQNIKLVCMKSTGCYYYGIYFLL